MTIIVLRSWEIRLVLKYFLELSKEVKLDPQENNLTRLIGSILELTEGLMELKS